MRHARVVGRGSPGEKTLANRLYPRLRPGELCTADRDFLPLLPRLVPGCRFGAALLWRAPTGLGLPVVRVLSDGTYLSVINPAIRGARRRAAILTTAGKFANGGEAELDPTQAHAARVIEYDVPDRVGNGTGELIVALSTILDPTDARAE